MPFCRPPKTTSHRPPLPPPRARPSKSEPKDVDMARRSARRRDRAEERPGRSLTLRVWRSQGFEVMGRHGCLRRRGVEEESGKPVFLGFLAQLLQWFIKVSNRSTELFDTQTPCSSFPPFHHTAPLKALPFPSLPSAVAPPHDRVRSRPSHVDRTPPEPARSGSGALRDRPGSGFGGLSPSRFWDVVVRRSVTRFGHELKTSEGLERRHHASDENLRKLMRAYGRSFLNDERLRVCMVL